MLRRGLCAGFRRWAWPSLVLLAASCGADEPKATSSHEAPAVSATASARSSASATSPPPATGQRLLGIRGFAVTVYARPDHASRRLGYLRVGAQVGRSAELVGRRGCQGGWYHIEPQGFVCAGAEATTNLDDPLLRAAAQRPDRDAPLPYRYGFVRAVLPLYLRVPTSQEQYKSEFKLAAHLQWYKEHRQEVQRTALGAADVPVDALGRALARKQLGELGRRKNSTEMGVGELFGGGGDQDPWPFWLRDGGRLIRNVSGFSVPEYAVFANRARRHTGLAFIGSFGTGEQYLRRRFAVTTDLRLAPTSKVKPDAASPWHGFELGGDLKPPLAIVRRRGAQAYRSVDGAFEPTGPLTRRSVHRLVGKVRRADSVPYYLLADGRWASSKEVGVVVAPSRWPRMARHGDKWIEVDLSEQTLVLWHGKQPEFATLVSTGRPAIGDPEATTASPRGLFHIFSKHVSATMDSDEGASKRHGGDKVLQPGDPGYVPQRGDGVYGVSLRRGHGLFKLRDVPYIQYFNKNYAIHGAYWHDVFGIARSHGCINLAPADALRVFKWTEPQVPPDWHGIRTEHGTAVLIHK